MHQAASRSVVRKRLTGLGGDGWNGTRCCPWGDLTARGSGPPDLRVRSGQAVCSSRAGAAPTRRAGAARRTGGTARLPGPGVAPPEPGSRSVDTASPRAAIQVRGRRSPLRRRAPGPGGRGRSATACEHSPATWRPVAPNARRSHSRQTSCRGPPRRTPFARANDQRARTLLTFGGSDAGHPCGRFLFMSSARVATRPPLVLIADSHEWFSRALETVLVPGGYRVVKAYTARGALQQVGASEPDAVILTVDLPCGEGLNLCRP